MRFFLNFICYTFLFVTALVQGASASEMEYKKAPSLTLATIKKQKYFSLFLDCSLNKNCWIMNYVDMGPDDNKQTDPACFNRTYDAHKGTDFAILDEVTMQKGVHVLAPLEGTVIKIRDNEPDQWSTPEQLDDIRASRKECGNAIMIDHGQGLQSIYCHLKKGSITVKPNQKVTVGDKMAQVGLSGFTEFPHLHFGILQDQKVIDPFTGQTNKGKCGTRVRSLWKQEENIVYQPFSIQSAGFLDNIPVLQQLEKDQTPIVQIKNRVKLFTFWTILLGLREGDEILLEVRDPNGKIFAENKIIQPKTRAQQFYYIGKDLKNKTLKEGAYTGEIKVTRTTRKGTDIVQNKIISILVSR